MNLQKIKQLKEDFGKIGLLACLTACLPIIGSTILLGVVYQLAPWLQENKELGVFLFVSAMTILAGLALVATNVLGIVSGYAFSFQIGLIAQILGIMGAATVMFFLSKRHAAERFVFAIDKNPKLKAIHRGLTEGNSWKTILLITLIRLSPAVPFALANFLISASGISFKKFFLGTFLGMLPRSSAIVFIGSSLTELDFSEPQESWTIIFGIVATILAIIVVGYISKNALDDLTRQQNDCQEA